MVWRSDQLSEDLSPQSITDPQAADHPEECKGKNVLHSISARKHGICPWQRGQKHWASFISSGDPLVTWTPSTHRISLATTPGEVPDGTPVPVKVSTASPLHICVISFMLPPLSRPQSFFLRPAAGCLLCLSLCSLALEVFLTGAQSHHLTLSLPFPNQKQRMQIHIIIVWFVPTWDWPVVRLHHYVSAVSLFLSIYTMWT